MSLKSASLLAFLLSSAATLHAQRAAWTLLHTTDELSGASDTRIIVRSREWRPRRRFDNPDTFYGASLVLACGDRLPGDSGRTLLFYAGEPMLPFGGDEVAYAELHLDGDRVPLRVSMPLLDWGDFPLMNTGNRSNRFVAFLGVDKPPYYSAALLARFLKADSLLVQYKAYEDQLRPATFDLHGLRLATDSLPLCHWPS